MFALHKHLLALSGFAASVLLTGCAPHHELGAVAAPAAITKLVGAKIAKASVSIAAAIPASATQAEEALPIPVTAPEVAWESWWRGFGVPKCSYLAPVNAEDFIAATGEVDVVFHFHAGQMSEREMKASGARSVFVSCGYGIGSGGYSAAFEDPTRFGWMMKHLLGTISRAKGREVHLGRLALASWSAGFAAVSRILAVPEWYQATDTVILLDSLHAQYVDSPIGAGADSATASARGVDHVDVRQLRRFTKFATDAARGEKTMIVTHSSIIPPDYASTSEATAALLREVGVAIDAPTEETDETSAERWGRSFSHPAGDAGAKRGKNLHEAMSLSVRADEGNLHVRGFRGVGPHDHFDHLHLIGEALRSWVVPRWYTPSGERR